ncbi:MAG: hypothetical protein A07HR60_02778 [uncultured archaeon A07HR60]|nr:MAG: hypothetical protein J07HR59_01103 [Halorubrum sp. J07HR59]ESS10759.1 MAG: hypothetical protein A07HR60_02778 [uncultured archaeon A07HR60]
MLSLGDSGPTVTSPERGLRIDIGDINARLRIDTVSYLSHVMIMLVIDNCRTRVLLLSNL